MATIKYGGFLDTYKTAGEAVKKARNGDTVILGSTLSLVSGSKLPKLQPLTVNDKTVYIEAKSGRRTTVFVGEHTAGIVVNGGTAYIKDIDFVCAGLTNAIYVKNKGSVSIENCTFKYNERLKIREREYYPTLFVDNGSTIELKNVVGENIKIINVSTARIYNSICDELRVTRTDRLSIVGSTLDGTTIASQNFTIDDTTLGFTEMSGNGNLSNIEIDANRREKYMLYLPELNGEAFSTVTIDDVSISKRVIENENAFLRVDSGNKAIVKNTNLPAMRVRSMLENDATIEFENVVDKIEWTNQGASVKHDRQSDSPLFAKPNSGQVKSAMEELSGLTGLGKAKEILKRFIDTASVNQEMQKRGISTDDSFSLHMVFGGHAGTGKTTVARLVGRALFENGVLTEDKFVETSAKDLVAGYVGQTAQKTHEVVQQAIGGVLFIDEMYGLYDKPGSASTFNSEAITQLIADMENNRGNLVVIGAGYTDEMKALMNSNEGLTSRFTNWVEFEDYTDDDLVEIGLKMLKNQKALLDVSDEEAFANALVNFYRSQGGNGNGRTVRNFVERVIMNRNSRNAGNVANLTNEELLTVTEQDLIF